MDKSEYRPHRFSVKDTALLLGISESYLGTLDREHSLIARRTERGKPFYTASNIAILREMGVGKRQKRLCPTGEAIRRLGLYSFGREPHERNPQAMLQARAAKPMEERELERLRTIQEEARRQRAREWRANKKESPEAAETVEEAPEQAPPRSDAPGPQTVPQPPHGDGLRGLRRRLLGW